jgi:ssRNA-specific RNase YbeY (16S rRNA maturation enzyme)
MCISDEKRFKELDKGGAIYSLSPKNFYLDKNKGNTEWTSKEKVKPIKKDVHESGLDAMIENGVYVYFCDEDTLQDLKKDPRDITRTMNILKGLVSENEKRGRENLIRKYY